MMKYEVFDCIDAGTEYCPCHLAETGECILCSQLNGRCFCDCVNWKGVCIYQEYVWNGNRAKQGREYYKGKVIKKINITKDFILLKLMTNHALVKHLTVPGSFIFIRNNSCDQYYDTPISIMDYDLEENTLTVVIEVRGIKTKEIDRVQENGELIIKGPFWNGVMGLSNINNCKEGKVILVARGIGQAPLIPVLKKLYSNGNEIITIIDKAPLNDIFIKKYLEMCNADVLEMNIFQSGELTEDFKNTILKFINDTGIKLVHCASQHIVIKKIVDLVGDRVRMSCCNNAKMCCGEGVCGACTVRYKGHKIKRYCKLQTEPKYLFEGRRFI